MDNKDNLISIAKWSKFLSIISYICIAILALCGIIVIGSSLAGIGSERGYELKGVIYIVLSVIMYFPSKWLSIIAAKLNEYTINKNEQCLSESLHKMKSLFQFTGYYIIVYLAIIALAILFVILW